MNYAARSTRADSQIGPAEHIAAVTPDDDNDLADGLCRAFFVGGAGDVVCVDAYGNEVVIASGASQYHPCRIKRFRVTTSDPEDARTTTATGIVALY